MVNCNADGVLMVHITKLFPSEDAQTFSAFGRVFSGTLTKGAHVSVRVWMDE
jgi:116 kDa U5 small nuclear ribonucleoprotein component